MPCRCTILIFVLSALPHAGVCPAGDHLITTVAGTGQKENNGDTGPARQINIGWPFGVEIGPNDAIYITECIHHRIRRLDRKTGRLTTVAGSGQAGLSGDGGAATEARLNQPYEVRFDQFGHMFFVEMQNHLVRRVDATTKTITTIAGSGTPGFSGDGGKATKAKLKVPHSIALDSKGFLYIADIGNHRIRRVELKQGTIETIAGNGENRLPTEGAVAKKSPLSGPRALAVAGRKLWVVLRDGNSVWTIDLDRGSLHHVAGDGTAGYSGDNGHALKASFNGPKGLAFGPSGDVFVVDSENDVIRRIDHRTHIVSTIAGSGRARAFGGDGGPPLNAMLSQPHGICIAADGTIYIGDTLNHRVRAVIPKP